MHSGDGCDIRRPSALFRLASIPIESAEIPHRAQIDHAAGAELFLHIGPEPLLSLALGCGAATIPAPDDM
jgi:hypothetical protein